MATVHPRIATSREGPRLLDEQDEPAFVALLRSVYGETYAYRALYEPGGVAALINSGRAALFGDVGPDGELFSHTAFLEKDVRGDYVESGLSFRGPRARLGTPDPEIWRRLFAWLEPRAPLVHQSTSTWHLLAQRYAERYMRARPTGLVIDYVQGERLVGMPVTARSMNALTMTTIVRPELRRSTAERLVPSGPWGVWLARLLRSLDVRSIVAAERGGSGSASASLRWTLEPIEQNDAISLARRKLSVRDEGSTEPRSLDDALAAPAPRTDLVHVPCDARMEAFPVLAEAGYVPVGVRIHVTRPDEIVLQRLAGTRRMQAVEALATAQLVASAKPLVSDWQATCRQTS